MKHIKIGNTDVFLDDKGEGKGKITISDTEYDYNFSFYWGAMGCNLEEFLLQINPDYFEGKLNMGDQGVFDAKGSIKNVRRYIREEMEYQLPWYLYPSAQKELRERLRWIEEYCCSEDEFVNDMTTLTESIYCMDLTRNEERNFLGIISELEQEPWYFIEKKPSQKSVWLKNFLPKLKKELSLENG